MNKVALLTMLVFTSCELFREKTLPVCESSTPNLKMSLVQSQSSASCSNPNGIIEVVATTGTPPFRYSIDESELQPGGRFEGLHAGEHLVRAVDVRGCDGFYIATVEPGGNVLTATVTSTPDNKCHSDAGTITITPHGGMQPFSYQRDSLTPQNDSIFYGLDKGFFWVKVSDATGCEYRRIVEVKHGNTGVSYSRHVQPVITSYCAYSGCHNGDVGSNNNFLVFSNVRTYGLLLVKYATASHVVDVPAVELAYIRCWVEDGSPSN